MARTWVDVPDDLLTQAKAAAEGEGIEFSALAARAILNELTTPAVPAPPPPAVTEDGIADHFLARLDPVKARMITTVTRDRGSRPYEAFLAWILKAADQGESAAMAIPGRDLARAANVAIVPLGSAECQWCTRTFALTNPGQIYCPDPDDGTESCGRQAMKAEMRAKRGEIADDRPYAPTQQPVEAIAKAMNNRTALLTR